MANRNRVRGYSRADGTKVGAHKRAGRPGAAKKPLVSPRHALDLLRRAFRAHKRGKKGLAVTLGALGLGELGAFATLRGAAVILVTAGVLAVAVGAVMGQMSGLH